MASAEVEPFAKTGGLGDVLGALPKALAKMGYDVSVVMPKYRCIPDEYVSRMALLEYYYVHLGWREQYCGVFSLKEDGVTYYFIDNEYYFGMDAIYTNHDLERFCYFEKAVMSMLANQSYGGFDILHCHDWQTGLLPLLVKIEGLHVKTVYTIHNLQYQGIFPWDSVWDLLDIPFEYFGGGSIEFYGEVNFMKGGMVHADAVTTVSPSYAEEIKYPFYGEKLEGLVQSRGDIVGIINGIDYNVYSPTHSPYIEKPFGIADASAGKAKNKQLLQRQLGLEVNPDAMVIGLVTRLSKQKGLELVEGVLDEIMQLPVQIALLGTGDPHYENLFRHYAYKYPGRISANIMFNNQLAHRIYAGSDAFLMPSLYEPCGLGQLISLSFGSIPIVREVGGLRDTITAYHKRADGTSGGNGFTFFAYNAHDMLYVINQAVELYADKPEWNALVQRAMSCDYSWARSAEQYAELYQRIAPTPGQTASSGTDAVVSV